MIFSRRSGAPSPGKQAVSPTTPAGAAPGATRAPGGRAPGFEYLPAKSAYLDSACQTLRPQPVIDAMVDYYRNYNACGERAKYAWGLKVDEKVAHVREQTLAVFGFTAKDHSASFTLNTTYGINLILNQLPKYARIVTTHTEHNSVFLPTIAYAARVGVPRVLLEKDDAGTIRYRESDLAGAIVVVSAMDNVRGQLVPNLAALVADVHRLGGAIVVDAAQAAPHALPALKGLAADAICFSAHKLYGASLGVVVARNEFLKSLALTFVGGGQVSAVGTDTFTLLPEPHVRLELGLQAWGEIIALGAAYDYLASYAGLVGEGLEAREHRLGVALYDGIAALGKFQMFGPRGSSLISVIPKGGDGHRFAVFLSKAEIMVRSGYFCAHHWLEGQLKLPPLVRFSLGAQNNDSDISYTLDMVGRLAKTL
ncbi:MAG: aminotransferase class V-fold PLP-dependent enzyme [Promicromonosporaceae bacterium]|nr:aminotransferase class V-fold PLP-dependent enzyme [Promicromonosporaceae bacterium]